METAVYFENIVRNFSRYNKYNLGAEMRTKSRDMVKLIIKANSSRNKLPLLYELREHIEEFKILIRISKESKAFHNFNSFKHAMECVFFSFPCSAWERNLPALCAIIGYENHGKRQIQNYIQ